MGKRRQERPSIHKQPLGDQIEDPETYGVRTKPRPEKRIRKSGSDDEDEQAAFLPGGLSDRILKEARAQQEEVDAGEQGHATAGYQGLLAAAMPQHAHSDSDDDEDNNLSAGEWDDDDDIDAQVAAEDEAALQAFMAPAAANYQQKTLADMIMDRIKQKQSEAGITIGDNSNTPRGAGELLGDLDPKVVEVYQGVGRVMSRYTAGKVPKAFKVIPNLKNWEEVLFLTEPELWSPHAVYQATRLFVSNLNQKMAQRFLTLVLLPHVRNDIRENRRLHFAYFQSLKKATYKPGAFYKGILLPLCVSGTCTLREAVIITSVIRRTSIPVLHSAAAMLRIAEMEYSGTNSFFIRVLLDKKYALPYRVIDALVDHFTRFQTEERQLPVVWHQALLCFVQRYKSEIRAEDKQALRKLCKAQFHYQVTPEVIRELDASRSRGEKAPVDAVALQQQQAKAAGQRGRENPRDLAPVIMMD